MSKRVDLAWWPKGFESRYGFLPFGFQGAHRVVFKNPGGAGPGGAVIALPVGHAQAVATGSGPAL